MSLRYKDCRQQMPRTNDGGRVICVRLIVRVSASAAVGVHHQLGDEIRHPLLGRISSAVVVACLQEHHAAPAQSPRRRHKPLLSKVSPPRRWLSQAVTIA